MALGLSEVTRNARLSAFAAQIDGGGAGGLLRIYSGARPATGAAITTQVLLATLTFSYPCAAAPSAGSLTFNGLTPGAGTAGTASWFRIVNSQGGFVADGSIGTSGSDLNFAGGVAIAGGQTVSISSWTIADNNA